MVHLVPMAPGEQGTFVPVGSLAPGEQGSYGTVGIGGSR
jgi:hypothetical protein